MRGRTSTTVCREVLLHGMDSSPILPFRCCPTGVLSLSFSLSTTTRETLAAVVCLLQSALYRLTVRHADSTTTITADGDRQVERERERKRDRKSHHRQECTTTSHRQTDIALRPHIVQRVLVPNETSVTPTDCGKQCTHWHSHSCGVSGVQ